MQEEWIAFEGRYCAEKQTGERLKKYVEGRKETAKNVKNSRATHDRERDTEKWRGEEN